MRIEAFDRSISQLLFKAIASIEVCLRAQVVQVLGLHYGARALHNIKAFKDKESFQKTQKRLDRETNQALRTQKPLAVHHLKKYGQLPIWAEVENSSFGTLSKIYGNLADSSVANEIAACFGVGRFHLKNWLRHLTQIRNLCAHHDRLYNKMFTVHPRLFGEYKHLHGARLFATFFVIFRMQDTLDEVQANLLRQELGHIIDTHPNVDLEPIGFPENWREILRVPLSPSLSIARPRGKQGGRPLKNADSVKQALYLYDMRQNTVAEIAKTCDLSLSTLYKYIHMRESNEEESEGAGEGASAGEGIDGGGAGVGVDAGEGIDGDGAGVGVDAGEGIDGGGAGEKGEGREGRA